jgi:hypothetical protein
MNVSDEGRNAAGSMSENPKPQSPNPKKIPRFQIPKQLIQSAFENFGNGKFTWVLELRQRNPNAQISRTAVPVSVGSLGN